MKILLYVNKIKYVRDVKLKKRTKFIISYLHQKSNRNFSDFDFFALMHKARMAGIAWECKTII